MSAENTAPPIGSHRGVGHLFRLAQSRKCIGFHVLFHEIFKMIAEFFREPLNVARRQVVPGKPLADPIEPRLAFHVRLPAMHG
jgi:hypothetical protein